MIKSADAQQKEASHLRQCHSRRRRQHKVNLHNGKVVDAMIRVIIDGGKKLQVDFGNDETALVQKWQIVEKL